MERSPNVTESDAISRLRDETEPVAGRPGWRVDANGKEWYSAAWLDEWMNGQQESQ